MHEFSLVRSLLSQVEAIAAEHGFAPVEEIRLEIGPLAGVEPLLLSSAYAQLVEGTPFRQTRLTIDEVPLGAECEACGHSFSIVDFQFLCPACGSRKVRVNRGDEIRLLGITIHEPASIPTACPENQTANAPS